MKWFRRITVAVVIMLLLGGGGGFMWLRQSLPKIDGSISLSGLKAAVTVVRDRHGIPHISAGNETDAAFALGFSHAQDRLWQMEMNRRIGAGRLSEILGEATVGVDRFLRMLGLYRHSKASLQHLSAETRAVFTAYTAGVNAFLKSHRGPLPPEFLILGHRPERWRVADSIVWTKVMALDLGGNWRKELTRLRLADRVGEDGINDFLTPYGLEMPRGVLAAAGLKGGPVPDLADRILSDDGLLRILADARPALSEGAGSNNWVVSGDRSATGKPLLANDPHLGLAAPAIWYLAHQNIAGRNVIGATLPGVPTVVLGRNDHIAWGFTNTEPDVQDLYFEKLDPADGNKYLTPGGSVAFEVREEVIKVKDAANVVMQVRSTRHGPVLSDAHRGAAAILPKGYVLALSWTALRDDDLTPQAGVELARAENWVDFVAAMSNFHAPQQNVVYADVRGNIGYLAPGRIPVRAGENRVMGVMPQPGWEEKYDWRGLIPFADLPRSYNPKEGIIATANHRIVDDDYPHHITFDWAAGFRAARIKKLLRARGRHSVDGFRAMQADVVSPFARAALPYLLKVKPASALSRRVLEVLRTWQGEMDRDQAAPLIFNAWIWQFAKLITEDDLSGIQADVWGRRGPFVLRVLRERPGWCDDERTAAMESCDEMLVRALDLAVTWIAERQGGEVSAWRWGAEHLARSSHRPFGKVDYLRRLFDITVPVSGSIYTINVGDFDVFDPAQPFASTFGPSLRAIYDLDDLNRSLFIHSTGQSGNPLSPHYADMAETWSRGGYLPMSTNPDDYAVGATGSLNLLPR
ncbi:MAG: penicillin acylase family protein [Alphaproteobacteria bacterium]|nr:penicillin acylase family protein [Alphaproteobacteria bacterium]